MRTLALAAAIVGIASVANAQSSYLGLTLISPRTSNDSYLIDNNFNVLTTWHGASSVAQVAYMLPDGSLLRPCLDTSATWGAGGMGGRIQRISASDVVVWDYLFSDAVKLQHHDIEPMPNGNVLIIAWERKTEAEAIAAGRQNIPFGELWPTLIAEVEPVGATGGNIVWEWHLWDHLIQDADPTKNNYGVIGDHPELLDINWAVGQNGSWDHGNALSYNPELDQIVYSARAMSEFYVVDHSTTTAEAAGHTGGNSGRGGDILYRWGNPQVYDRGTETDRYYFSVHGAVWIEPGLPGAGNILTFNNGNRIGELNDYSSVAEIVPPHDGYGHYYIAEGAAYGPASPKWVYEAPPGFYSKNKAGAFRLPNGNTLITEANANNIFEVSTDGTNVWQYTPPGEVHRAKRYWSTLTSVDPPSAAAKGQANFPNPFNAQTTIAFDLPTVGNVKLEVFDIRGRLVVTLIDEEMGAGPHEATWSGVDRLNRRVSSGVYFYRLAGPGFTQTTKIILAK